MASPLLEVNDLRVLFRSDAGPREILHGIGFTVSAGEAVGIVGESGSGKSVTVRSIIRLLPKKAKLSGSVRFEGREVLGLPPEELRRYRLNDVGMMFQDPRAHINPIRSIGSFLTEALVLEHGVARAEAKRRAIALLDDVGVSSPARRLTQRPHELSGGLLQRVMIASVLLAQPKLILADEISTALDVTTQEEVMAILDEERRNRGLSMVFITHDLDLAAAVCDRLLVMKEGAIVETLVPGSGMRPRDPYSIALMQARSWFAASRSGEVTSHG